MLHVVLTVSGICRKVFERQNRLVGLECFLSVPDILLDVSLCRHIASIKSAPMLKMKLFADMVFEICSITSSF